MTSRRLRIVAGAILIVGFATAIGIYVSAPSSPDDMVAYEIEHSKQYRRALEIYGGKANVVAVEITQWFESLWHGTRLAYTVACATVMVASVLWLGAVAAEE